MDKLMRMTKFQNIYSRFQSLKTTTYKIKLKFRLLMKAFLTKLAKLI